MVSESDRATAATAAVEALTLRELMNPNGHGWYYLSFVDTTDAREDGDRWLGGCVVEAYGVVTAIQRAWDLGINPGGEVASVGPLPKPESLGVTDRLLNREEVTGLK